MILQVYSVLDKAVNSFLPPVFVRSRGEILRSFSSTVNEPGNQMNRFASDYVLFYLCDFDDASGLFAGGEPVRVLSALEALVDNPVAPPERSQS